MSAIIEPLYVTGSADGKLILGGMFQMHDRIGFPVDCCIDEARDRGFLIDWLEALADCWLNDCLKFDSFVRQAGLADPSLAGLAGRFATLGSLILARFPKMRHTSNPIDTVCRYILAKKRAGRTLE